jgi:L-fucose isomerase-like protein
MRGMNRIRVAPVFLLGSSPDLEAEDRAGLEREAESILEGFDLSWTPKALIEKEEDLLGLDAEGVDAFVLFPYSSSRFTNLIWLADLGRIVYVLGEGRAFPNALDTYEYLADHGNVRFALDREDLQREVRSAEAAEWVRSARVCLFDKGGWGLEKAAYLKNPAVGGMLNVQRVDEARFMELFEGVKGSEAEDLARGWMAEAEVREPSFEDVVRSARVYLAMRAAVEEMEAEAAYVLWCGQFTRQLGTKMCFALAKLGDDGLPVGCWRGENLLPLLILRAASGEPVFVCEAQAREGRSTSFRHCFAPGVIASCRYVLRPWRDMEATVTGYCQLPDGEVTLVNSGIGDSIVVAKGMLRDCGDLGGENCRITAWVDFEDEAPLRNLRGRECAIVYGDYAEEARLIGERLGLKVL